MREREYASPAGNKRGRLLLSAGDVLAGTRVDAEHIAFVNEKRHSDDGTRLELCRLLSAGSRIAPDAGIRLDRKSVV